MLIRSRPYVSSPATGRQSIPADLLEVGELADLEPVGQTANRGPHARGSGSPVVLDEAEEVVPWLGADREERLEVLVLDVDRRGLPGSPGTG